MKADKWFASERAMIFHFDINRRHVNVFFGQHLHSSSKTHRFVPRQKQTSNWPRRWTAKAFRSWATFWHFWWLLTRSVCRRLRKSLVENRRPTKETISCSSRPNKGSKQCDTKPNDFLVRLEKRLGRKWTSIPVRINCGRIDAGTWYKLLFSGG